MGFRTERERINRHSVEFRTSLHISTEENPQATAEVHTRCASSTITWVGTERVCTVHQPPGEIAVPSIYDTFGGGRCNMPLTSEFWIFAIPQSGLQLAPKT